MRKRSKKRIPQDIIPWSRVTQLDDDTINIFNKKNSRGFNSARRKYQTTIFNSLTQKDLSSVLLKSYLGDQRVPSGKIRSQLLYNQSQLNQVFGESLAKNFCLFLGAGRTYNRKLFISRQCFRKLVKTGLLSGIQK